MTNGMIGILVVGAIAVIAILWYISTMNRFERLAVKIRESDSGIDVALEKRYDTLTKMLDVTKGYAKHEAETLASIVKMRKDMGMEGKNDASRQMDELTDKIHVLVEAYPELKASENFKQLQLAVMDAEEHLQAARRVYNMNVSSFNQLLAAWPSGIVGGMKRHASKPFFAASEHKKNDVEMTF